MVLFFFSLVVVGLLAACKLMLMPNVKSPTAHFFFNMFGEPIMYTFLFVSGVFHDLFLNLALAWVLGFFLVLPFFRKVGIFGYEGGAGDGNRRITRGTVIVDEAYVKRSLKETDTHAVIGSIPIPVSIETLNFLFAGAPGSGKTLAFFQVLSSVRERGMPALIADMGGEFVSRFYRPDRDKIINPFDERGVNWSPFAEMKSSFDAARLAMSMIPTGADSNSREWNGYTRTVLEAILERLFESGQATNQQLCYYCLGASAEDLTALVAGSAATSYFTEGNERMLGSIRGILSSYLKPYTYLEPTAGTSAFSVRQHVQSGADSWLFLSYRDDQLQALQPMIAAQIDIAASGLLSLDTELSRRFWVALDEFASLGYVSQMEPLLSKGRKKGVCAVLGMQSIAQPRATYGQNEAQTLLACLGTWLVLRQPDKENAEYMVGHFGKQEFVREIRSTGTSNSSKGFMDSGSSGKSENISEQHGKDDALMTRDFQNMAPRNGLLDLSGPMPPAWTTIPILELPEAAPSFADKQNVRAMRIERPGGDGSDPAATIDIKPIVPRGPKPPSQLNFDLDD